MKVSPLWAALAATAVALPAAAGPSAPVPLEACLSLVSEQVGSAISHVEFESRRGEPTYELAVNAKGADYYVGCSGVTGLISEVDVLVKAEDPRWTAAAKIAEEEAKARALARYPGDVEEVKRLLLQSGPAVYEVEIEIPGGKAEFNVYVNAADGSIDQVNLEYWEIPEAMAGDSN